MTGLAASLLALLVQAPSANAADVSAEARFDQAKALYDQGRYDDAAEMFRQLHESTGKPVLLSSIAQSLRLAGRCADALIAYERFVDAEAELKQMAAAASAGAGIKRVITDLQLAHGRIVEMRICASRNQSEPARQAAFRRLAAGEHAEALQVLQQIWEDGHDPTLLAEIAEIHRGQGHCDEAGRLLNLAVVELAPIEVLGTETPSRDAAIAIEALRRARMAKLEFRCGVARAAGPPPPEADSPESVTKALVSPPPPPDVELNQSATTGGRKRWPLYTAIGGAAVAVGGVASWAMMKKTESDIRRHLRQDPGNDIRFDERRNELMNQGRHYERLGAVLVGVGASVATASAIYWYLSSERPAATAVVQPRPGGATFGVHSKF